MKTNTHVHQRPWGTWTLLSKEDHSLVKIIQVNPNARLSEQSHVFRNEHWVIIEGRGLISIDGVDQVYSQNQYVFIPKGSKHRVKNIDPQKPLLIVEVQTGEKCIEEDIIRYDDDYGRVTPQL
ncbi:MAG: phosphomannose isomerase type II C-terminal cupin domain [Bdellovibrionota bacterium]